MLYNFQIIIYITNKFPLLILVSYSFQSPVFHRWTVAFRGSEFALGCKGMEVLKRWQRQVEKPVVFRWGRCCRYVTCPASGFYYPRPADGDKQRCPYRPLHTLPWHSRTKARTFHCCQVCRLAPSLLRNEACLACRNQPLISNRFCICLVERVKCVIHWGLAVEAAQSADGMR